MSDAKMVLTDGDCAVVIRKTGEVELVLPELKAGGEITKPALVTVGLGFLLGRPGWADDVAKRAVEKLEMDGILKREAA